MDDNLLRELPAEIGSLRELRVLSCHNNILRLLPNSLVKLSNLAILNVSANKIRHLPPGMKLLSRLEDLQIQNNKIRQLEAFFHMLFDLQVFGCDWFSYTSPPLPVLSNQVMRVSNNSSSEEEITNRAIEVIESLKNLSLVQSHRGLENPKIEFVTFLQHFSSGCFSINWQDERGRTPLHSAVMQGDYTTVDMLLSYADSDDPIDLNILDRDQYSALGMAMREEKMRIAYKILDQRMHPLNLEIGGGSHSTLMHLAVAKLDVKAVVKLILRNADLNCADLKSGDRPLHLLINVFAKN